jgi:S1-C subfamily serine protease
MNVTKYVIIFVGVLLSVSFSGAILAQDLEEKAMIEKIKQAKESTVKIICDDINSSGSGFIAAKDGYIITNFHVVGLLSIDPTSKTPVITYSKNIRVKLSSGETLDAKVAVEAQDLRPIVYDYCILKVSKDNLIPFEMGEFDDVEEGSNVYFCGYPFGKDFHTVHKGMISSKHIKNTSYELNNRTVEYKLLQIDGSVNKGNSGGPLISYDSDKVIGIVSMREGGITQGLKSVSDFIKEQQKKASGGSVFLGGVNPVPVLKELIDVLDSYISVGIGFAISIEYAREHLSQLK